MRGNFHYAEIIVYACGANRDPEWFGLISATGHAFVSGSRLPYGVVGATQGPRAYGYWSWDAVVGEGLEEAK